MRSLTLSGLFAFVIIAVAFPSVAAAHQPAAGSQNVLCRSGYGEAEVDECVGQACGCNCPVAGAGVELVAVGHKVTVLAATVLVVCGTAVVVDDDASDAPAPSVHPFLITHGVPRAPTVNLA